MEKIDIIIIDPQFDFCCENGSLYIPGANEDMSRLAYMIEKMYDRINDIHVSLDTHHFVDLGHPVFWLDKEGKNPAPFTSVSAKDIEEKRWVPFNDEFYEKMLDYVEKTGDIEIWPPHCLLGSQGHSIHPILFDALRTWSEKRKGVINYIPKGGNIFVEHHSAVKAKMPQNNDIYTHTNFVFSEIFERCDMVLLGGEAGTRCTLRTAEDIYDILSKKELFSKLIWLEDAVSPVPGFEKVQIEGMEKLKEKGMRVAITKSFI